jgi:hypothetical protein
LAYIAQDFGYEADKTFIFILGGVIVNLSRMVIISIRSFQAKVGYEMVVYFTVWIAYNCGSSSPIATNNANPLVTLILIIYLTANLIIKSKS